jgi:hypothetical protein
MAARFCPADTLVRLMHGRARMMKSTRYPSEARNGVFAFLTIAYSSRCGGCL